MAIKHSGNPNHEEGLELQFLLTSPEALLRDGSPDPELIRVLIQAEAAHRPVGVLSNQPEPSWFAGAFQGSGVQFLKFPGRQDGRIIGLIAQHHALYPFNVVVLAAKPEDVQMGKNGGAVLVGAGWSPAQDVQSLGIGVQDPQQLQEVIDLTANWAGQWWFTGTKPRYKVCALADLSTYGRPSPQQVFADKLTATVKHGGSRLNALLAITARSLLMDGLGTTPDLLWGVYPSSASRNDDHEILSDFTHRLRTTVSRVRFAKRDQPLFIRHTPSRKRSAGGSGGRTDPTEQILTLHLNPYYQDKQRLVGRHVVVVDDCTTYGVSFGVAAAFLRKAGAASVTGIALGKFGRTLGYYEIDLQTDPFQPVTPGRFSGTSLTSAFTGTTSSTAQVSLQTLVP